jgi:hypothetical protein
VGTCDCMHDGYCPRYGREMVGRFREICRGVNVDLGTAAAFREQWVREASPPRSIEEEPQRIALYTDQAAGDAVAMTAAIYSLHRAHPGKYLTSVHSLWPEVFWHNPNVVHSGLCVEQPLRGFQVLRMHYPAIHASNERAIHFMQAWCEHLSASLRVQVSLLTDRPHLHFAEPERPQEDYWLVCSGGKTDFTNKLWGQHNYQEVVDRLRGRVRFVQVGDRHTDHPDLMGVQHEVGNTTLRQLFDLTRRARGVLCGVSLLMHVAAALDKPAVVVAGGREPVAWNAYPKQHYLHTVGMLPCHDLAGLEGRACWRSRVLPLGDGTVMDKGTCERPRAGLPECMRMIAPAEVAALIARYNDYR